MSSFDGDLNKLKNVIDATYEYVENMKDGERTNLKDLSQKIADKVGLTASMVRPLIRDTVLKIEGVSVKPGRYGGIQKGAVQSHQNDRARCTECHQMLRQKRSSNETATESTGETLDAASNTIHDGVAVEDESDPNDAETFEPDLGESHDTDVA